MTEIETWWQYIGCIRNPGAFTGEEAARDWEIKALRERIRELEFELDKATVDVDSSYDDWVGYHE